MFRFACLVALWGGRGAADKSHQPVWAALTVFRPLWVGPRSRWACMLTPSTPLRLPAALYRAGPELRAVPGFGFSTKAQTQLGLHLVPFPALATQAARSLTGALSPGAVRLIPSMVPASVSAPIRCALSVLGSLSLAATLPGDVNHPESQEVFG